MSTRPESVAVVGNRRISISAEILKLAEVGRVAFANRLAYVWDALSRPLFFVLILFVFIQLWRQVFTPDRPVVEGFSLEDTLWYMVMTEAILISAPRFEGRIDDEIKSGSIAYLITRPCHYILYHLSYALGETVPLFFLTFGAGWATCRFLVGPAPVAAWSVPFVGALVVLAFLLYALLSFCVALSAFWFEEATPFFWVLHKCLFIGGGLLLPLDFLPGWLRQILDFLPFKSILYSPAKAFVHGSWEFIGAQFLWQILWIAIFLAIAFSLFGNGMKKLQIHGG